MTRLTNVVQTQKSKRNYNTFLILKVTIGSRFFFNLLLGYKFKITFLIIILCYLFFVFADMLTLKIILRLRKYIKYEIIVTIYKYLCYDIYHYNIKINIYILLRFKFHP